MGRQGRIERDVATLFGRADPAFVRFDPGEEGNRLLWVVCSHVNIPPGKFAQSRMMRRMRGAKLYLNCQSNGWYQSGVGGEFATIDALMAAIGGFSEGFERTNFLGHSMGAYLALALAHEFDRGGQFLATSPEAVLGLPASRSHENRVRPRQGWADLIKRFGSEPPKTPGVTLFGGHDPVDAHFLASVPEGFYGQLGVVPHHHGVTEYLTARRHYRPLLTSPIKGLVRLTEAGLVMASAAVGTPAQFDRFAQAHRLMRQSQVCLALDLTEADPDWENAGWQGLRAELFRRQGQSEKALIAACRADRASPGVPRYVRERARAVIALGDRAGASDILLEIAGQRHEAFTKIRGELVASGLVSEAAKALESRAALARAHAEALDGGVLPDLARSLVPHLPTLIPRPDLAEAAYRVVLQAGLRRSALSAAEAASEPGARGLAQRIKQLMPRQE